jgi:hypothetical protein
MTQRAGVAAEGGTNGDDAKVERYASNKFAPLPKALLAAYVLTAIFSLGVENAAATRPAWLTDLQNITFFVGIGMAVWGVVSDRRITPALRTRIRELRAEKERRRKVLKRGYKLLLAVAAFAAAWTLGWAVGRAENKTATESSGKARNVPHVVGPECSKHAS